MYGYVWGRLGTYGGKCGWVGHVGVHMGTQYYLWVYATYIYDLWMSSFLTFGLCRCTSGYRGEIAGCMVGREYVRIKGTSSAVHEMHDMQGIYVRAHVEHTRIQRTQTYMGWICRMAPCAAKALPPSARRYMKITNSTIIIIITILTITIIINIIIFTYYYYYQQVLRREARARAAPAYVYICI